MFSLLVTLESAAESTYLDSHIRHTVWLIILKLSRTEHIDLSFLPPAIRPDPLRSSLEGLVQQLMLSGTVR